MISEEQVRYVYVGPYAIDDQIPIPFTYTDATNVKAYRSDGTEYVIAQDYEVDGQNLIVKRAVSSTEKLVLYRQTALDNDSEFPQEGNFDSEKINDALDKLTRQNQEENEQLERAVKFARTTDSEVTKLVFFPEPEPGKAIRWNNEGTNLVNTDTDIDTIIEQSTINTEAAERYARQARISAENALQSETRAAESAALARRYLEEGQYTSDDTYININNETKKISLNYAALLQVFTEAEWANKTEQEKAAIPYAFIYDPGV